MTSKNDVRLVKLEDKFAQILDRLTKMDEKMDGLDHIIRGNGRPGLASLQNEHELRLKALEGTRKSWRELAILIASGGVIAVLTAYVQHFVR